MQKKIEPIMKQIMKQTMKQTIISDHLLMRNTFFSLLLLLFLSGCQSAPKASKVPDTYPRIPINKKAVPEVSQESCLCEEKLCQEEISQKDILEDSAFQEEGPQDRSQENLSNLSEEASE